MGTKVAPAYANTFMGRFERIFVATYPKQPLLWKRFIDDIFLIWTFGLVELRLFETFLNQCLPSIKFETDISESSVHFLDTTVILGEDGTISTTLYTKPTDAHNYLSYFSCHPKNCRDSIPYSQFLRDKRICSSQEDFVENSRNNASHFIRAGYTLPL